MLEGRGTHGPCRRPCWNDTTVHPGPHKIVQSMAPVFVWNPLPPAPHCGLVYVVVVRAVGVSVGTCVGISVDGAIVGAEVGGVIGSAVGTRVGPRVGTCEGAGVVISRLENPLHSWLQHHHEQMIEGAEAPPSFTHRPQPPAIELTKRALQ